MLTASLKRISDLEDHLDLMKDEFQRIKALTDNPEILGLCDRASQSTTQKVSVIRQRDSAETELTKLKDDVVRLRQTLTTCSDSLPLLLGHKSHWDHTMQGGIGCPKCIEQKQIIDGLQQSAARALEETKP